MGDTFWKYRRRQISELRRYEQGEVLSDRVSVSASDREAGSPRSGDMIARNPKDHDDQWLVSAQYFADNFELIEAGGRFGFGEAIKRLQNGERVAREGWNGKGMWLMLITAGNALHKGRYGSFDMQDCIGMKTAQGCMQPGWLASQADMLAIDWQVVE